MSSFAITGCTVADAGSLARNNMSAFWTDANWKALWDKGQTIEFIIEQAAKRMPRNLLRNRETLRHIKAVDPATGNLVGYARWILPATVLQREMAVWPDAQVPDVSPSERSTFEELASTAIWHINHNMDHLDVPVIARKAVLASRKDYMILDYLAVSPENKGQGIATALVKAGIDEAKALGLDVFVLALKQGFGVYRKIGFTLLDQIVQDDSMYGGDGEWAVYFMEYPTNPPTDG